MWYKKTNQFYYNQLSARIREKIAEVKWCDGIGDGPHVRAHCCALKVDYRLGAERTILHLQATNEKQLHYRPRFDPSRAKPATLVI